MTAVVKSLAVVLTTALFGACGGGSDEFMRAADRQCAGPFLASFSGVCPVELRLAGDELIEVEIAGRIVAANSTGRAVSSSRALHVQLAGAAAGFDQVRFDVAPGGTGSRAFALRVTVPAANLGGAPAVIGLSSYETVGEIKSVVADVHVSAVAR